jgi:hypothetical protein
MVNVKSLHGEQQPDNSGPLSSATSSTKDGYPKRSPVFALKAIRLMGKVVVCQEIGGCGPLPTCGDVL